MASAESCAMLLFYKQKTTYEMRISDWSSDVCSSDLWFQKAGLTTLRPYLDPENALLDAAAGGLPTSLYYDAEGKEVWRVMGAIDWQGEEAKALLAEAGA